MGVEVKLVFHTEKVIKSIEDAAGQRMAEAVMAVHKTVVEETLVGSRTGRTYYVPGTKRTYTASAPGEPPAQATGRLRQSIGTSVKSEGKTVIGKVGSDLPYAARLEFGFRDTDSLGRRYNMAPRPWLRPSFEKSLGKIKSILGSKWF